MRRPLHTWDKKPLPPEASETGHPAGQRPRCNTAAAFQVREPSTCTKALCAQCGSSSGTLCVAAASSNPLSHSEAYGKPLLGVALEVSVGSVDHLAARFLGTCGPKVATRTPPRPLQLVVAVQGGATGRWQLAPGLEARLRGLLCQCGIAAPEHWASEGHLQSQPSGSPAHCLEVGISQEAARPGVPGTPAPWAGGSCRCWDPVKSQAKRAARGRSVRQPPS
mmetsp:Transcript_14409/g.31923  ORF Transcript_14409/g.31923 Transcript_14409/m.31923 type:complete len:222 (+) Transcript_14409:1107-1772(+)